MALTIDAVAAESGVSVERVQELVDLGVIERDPDDGFAWADLQRVRAVRQFLDAGIPWDAMHRAIVDGLITFRHVDAFFLEPAALSGRTYGEFQASLGADGRWIPRVYDTFGLAEPPSDQPMRLDEERCLAALLHLWRRVGGTETLLRASRVLGDHTRATVEGWMALWDQQMRHPDAGDRAASDRQQETLELGRGLTDLLPQVMLWAEQRYLEQAMTAVGVDQMESVLADRGIIRPREQRPPAVLFVDLAGFSRLTEAHGDEAAARFGTLLRDVAVGAARRHGGRLIKLLGDGALLHFTDAGAAIRAGTDMLAGTGWDPDLPPPHIGVHAGPVVAQDGDIFGATVNIAARLSAIADPDQMLASEAAVRAAGPIERVRFEPMGPLKLKGISQPVSVMLIEIA